MSQLALDPPAPVGAPPMLAENGVVPVDPARQARIEAIAREFAGGFLSLGLHDPAFDRESDRIASVGRREVAALSDQARRALARSSASEGITRSLHSDLDRLRAVVARLDPGAGEGLLKPRKLLGFIPLGGGIADYFASYSSAETEIEAVLAALVHGRDRLIQDNIAIDADRAAGWPLLLALAEAVQLCAALDTRFDKLASQLDSRDPPRARRLREGPLFQARQRHQDLLTQMAVSMQGYQLLVLIRSNNGELIKGIDRASATTVTALRTAMVAAQTLAGQRLLLERIAGVTNAASTALGAAAAPIADGNARIALDSAEASAQVAALHRAFAEVQTVVDSLDMEQRSGLRTRRASDLSASL
jgi:uncharacterized protein YaaN involved in tellurite resistance